MTAVFLVFLLGMVAFSVDISYLVLIAGELQNVADSAALAGANKLGDNLVMYTMPTQTTANKNTLRSGAVTTATSTAKTYATYNNVGNTAMSLLDADIECGFTSSTGTYTSYASDNTKYPNTVKVTARRDSSANDPISLFFAPVLGISNMSLTANATATLYTGTINSFKTGGTVSSGMLPVTYDVNDWNTFISSGQDKAGVKSTDASGNPILQVYGTVKDTGNFGLLTLDDSHAGASTISNWITNGMSSADITALKNAGLLPLSSHAANTWDWLGDTGFKASNAMDINAQVGKTYLLPLYTPYTSSPYNAGNGNGSHYYYDIVQFVGVTIMPSSRTNKEVWVKPTLVNDPNMILSNVSVADGSSSTIYTSTTVKLIN